MGTKKQVGEEEFSVMYTVYASTHVKFFAPANSTYEQLAALAEKHIDCPSVCHQCSDKLEVGDLGDLNEIVNLTRKVVVEPK